MKRLGLIALSLIPIPLGLLTDHLMMNYNWFGFPLFLIGIVFYIFWFFMGYISVNWTLSMRETILYSHSVAILCAALIVGQLIILERFTQGLLGLIPQMYFLPMITPVSLLIRNVFFFISPFRIEHFIIPAFLMMLGIYIFGYWIKAQQLKLQNREV
jgi:hypothetical protein